MEAAYPELTSFLNEIESVPLSAEPRPFDRMMFDVIGEVNHVCAAMERDPDGLEDALSAFGRVCMRVYADPEVTSQRKFSLRANEWVFRLWCCWGVKGISRKTATRWFDAWQHERDLSLLRF